MNCDPNALAAAARCFSCLPPSTLHEVDTYLLCQSANQITTSTAFSSLIHYWPFDEASGTRQDYIGTLHFFEETPVSPAAGLRGNALDFTNANASLKSASTGLMSQNPPYSINIWFKYPGTTSQTNIDIVGGTDSNPDALFRIQCSADSGAGFINGVVWEGTIQDNMTTGPQAFNRNYNMMTVTVSDAGAGVGGATIYWNGVSPDSGFYEPCPYTNARWILGNGSGASAAPAPTYVDSLMMFNSVLTPAQVTDLYNHGLGKFPTYTPRSFPYAAPATSAWNITSSGAGQASVNMNVKPVGAPDTFANFGYRYRLSGGTTWTDPGRAFDVTVPSSYIQSGLTVGAQYEFQTVYSQFGAGIPVATSDWSSSKFFTVV